MNRLTANLVVCAGLESDAESAISAVSTASRHIFSRHFTALSVIEPAFSRFIFSRHTADLTFISLSIVILSVTSQLVTEATAACGLQLSASGVDNKAIDAGRLTI
jgi:hypothetical protein